MDDFCVRIAEEDDVPVLLELIRELAIYEKRLDSVVVDEGLLRSALFERRVAGALVGEIRGLPVGYAVFFHSFSTFIGRPGIHIEDVFVLPDYRGRGFGRAFFAFLARLAVESECWGLEWTCLDWNQSARDLYSRMGAVHLEEWLVYRLEGDALKRFL